MRSNVEKFNFSTDIFAGKLLVSNRDIISSFSGALLF